MKFDRKVVTEEGIEYSFTVGTSHLRATFNIEENGEYSYVKIWQGKQEWVLDAELYHELKKLLSLLDKEMELRRRS